MYLCLSWQFVFFLFFFHARARVCVCGTATQRGSWPHSWGFYITHNNAPQSVGLLWTSDQLVAETSTWQHTTLTTDKHPCRQCDRTHNLSRRAAADLRLRPRGHWDGLFCHVYWLYWKLRPMTFIQTFSPVGIFQFQFLSDDVHSECLQGTQKWSMSRTFSLQVKVQSPYPKSSTYMLVHIHARTHPHTHTHVHTQMPCPGDGNTPHSNGNVNTDLAVPSLTCYCWLWALMQTYLPWNCADNTHICAA